VEKLADEEIGRATVYAIELNVSVSHDRIKVRVQDGSITLTGEVEWAHQRQAAEQAGCHGFESRIPLHKYLLSD